MRKETLEEVAERIAHNFEEPSFKAGVVYGIIEGATSDAAKEYWFEKFQQEQDKNKYSEEDVIELLIRCPYVLPSDVKNWFEQYKKK
jgi:hypothetical protein